MKKSMLYFIIMVISFSMLFPVMAFARSDAANGDWSLHYFEMIDGPEAEYSYRVGDIDNFNFGFRESFDVFSGKDASSHSYPWTANNEDPDGTDRIMVNSSYNYSSKATTDGYTSRTQRPENTVRPIVMDYSLGNISVSNACLQIYLDDLQPTYYGQTNYVVTLNGRNVPEFTNFIRTMPNQSGPVGRLITWSIPSEFLNDVESGYLELKIDDTTSGIGDGYAIDFVKLLVNTKEFTNAGAITGTIIDADTRRPISGANVSFGHLSATSDASGNYSLYGLPPTDLILMASKPGYGNAQQSAKVNMGETVTVDFELTSLASTEEPTPTPTPEPTPQPTPDESTGGENIGDFTGDTITAGAKLWWYPMRGGLGYRVYRSEARGEEGISATDFYITSNEFVDVNVDANKTYYYTIRQVIEEARPFEGQKEVLGPPSAQIMLTMPSEILGGNGSDAAKPKQYIMMTMDSPMMNVNGYDKEIDPGRGTTPVILNNRTMVPIRAIIEEMGGTVDWNENTGQITLSYDGKTVLMWMNNRDIQVNGVTQNIDVAPASINDRTMVPIRFATENIGQEVEWINSERKIVIVYQ